MNKLNLTLLILISFVLCSAFVSADGEAVETDALGYSLFDCNQNANDIWAGKDGTAGGTTFVNTNPVSYGSSGSGGYYGVFDGSDSFTIDGDYGIFDGTKDFSFTFWMKYTDDSAEHTIAWFNGENYIRIRMNGGNFETCLLGVACSGELYLTWPDAAWNGVWTHFAITYSASTGSNVYTNGYLNTTDSGTGSITAQSSTSAFGNDPPNTHYGTFHGDQFKIYNTSLSAAEVLRDYSSGSTNPSAPTPSNYIVSNAVNPTAWSAANVTVDSDLLSFTFDTDSNSNCSASTTEGNYTQMITASANNKLATTETTSQAGTLFDSLSTGSQCIYISCIGTDSGLESASGVSSSGCLGVDYNTSIYVIGGNSYAYRRNITNETGTSLALGVNGTTGFQDYHIWTNSSSDKDLFLYYNINGTMAVGNNSEVLPYEIEETGEGYLTTSIYDSVLTYHFGINDTTPRDSTGVFNGTLAGGPTWATDGIYGNYMSFDGTNDYMTTTATVTDDLYAVSFWINNGGLAVDCATYEPILGTAASYPLIMQCQIGFNSQPGVLTIAKSGTDTHSLNDAIGSGWQFIVMNYNTTASAYDFYVNGTKGTQISYTTDPTVITTDAVYYLARNDDAGSWYADIDLDEFNIFSSPLTPDQITEMYDNSLHLNMLLGEEEAPTPPEPATNTINVSLISPADSSTSLITPGQQVNYTYLPTWTGDLINCSWLTNISGTFGVNDTNISAITNGSNNIFSNSFSSETSFIWNVECCGTSDCNRSAVNFTHSISLNAEPVVTLNKPSDASSLLHYIYNQSGIVFNFSAVDNEASFSNCSLYHNASGTFSLNQTNTSAITNNTNFNFDAINLSIGNYIWNVECCDSEDQCNFASANFSLELNHTAPYWLYNISNTSVLEDFASFTYLYNLSDYATDYDGDNISFSVQAQNTSEVICNITGSSGGFCYQENATDATACGGLDTGSYNYTGTSLITPTLSYDGDWSTAGSADLGFSLTLNTNYTKPETATSALWQVKTGGATVNRTIEGTCFSAYDELVLRITAGTSGLCAPNCARIYCHNGTDWNELDNTDIGDGPGIYEEAINWNLGQALTLTAVDDWFGNASCTIGINNTESGLVGENRTFWIEVTNVNDNPYFDPALVDQSTNTSEVFYYNITCKDVDTGTTITYTDNTTIFDINSATGNITQLVYEKYRGDNSIKITCSDGIEDTSSVFNLEVNDTTPPRYVSSTATELTIDFCAATGTQVINATFDDWYLSEGSTVYFSHNASGTWNNVSALFIGSLNLSRHSWYYSIPSAWSSAGEKHYKFIAIDNASNVNDTAMDTTSFFIAQNTSTITLYLNGLSQDRKYELTWGPNITGTLNTCTNETVWLDIGDPNYGVNYTSGENSSVYYNYNITGITNFEFSDGTSTANLTYATAGNKTFDITLPGKSTITSAYIVINGTNLSTSYPTNVKIDVANDSSYDVVIPGELVGNTSTQSTFTNNKTAENMSFSIPGAVIRYLNVSANAEGNSIGFRFPEITMNVSGYAIDEEGVDFYDYFNNETYNYRENTCQGPLWIWDDFSQGDVSGRWDGDYTVLANNYIYHVGTTSTSCTVEAGNSCCDSCQTNDNQEFYSKTLNLEDTKETKMRIRVVGSYSSSDSGSCICDPSANAGATAGIRDKTTTLKTGFMSASGATSKDKIVKIKVENGYLNWYEDDVFIGNMEYDSSHQYEVYGYQSAQYEKQGHLNIVTAYAQAQTYIYHINKSGVTGSGGMDLYDNCSLTYPVLLNVSQADNISKATFSLGYDELGSGDADYTLELSNDNGTTWEDATNGIVHVFTSKGSRLTARINLSASSDNTLVTNQTHISVVPGYITGLAIDLGYDGSLEYSYTGTLNVTNSPQLVEMETSSIKEYINNSCLGSATCLVPVAFISTTAGNLEYSLLNVTQSFDKVYINYSKIDAYFNNIVGNGNMTSSVHSDTAGIIQLSGLNVDYKGGSNYSIKTHFDGNENYTAVSDTQYVMWRYSPTTTTYPGGIDYYNVYPSSVNSKNIGPYGQQIRSNESESIAIWNITTTAKEDPVRIYRWYNPEVDSCLTLTSCQYFNKTGCTQVTNTSSQVVAKGNMYNGTEYKLYDFWNLTSCDPTNLFLPGDFTFRPICQDCVRIW